MFYRLCKCVSYLTDTNIVCILVRYVVPRAVIVQPGRVKGGCTYASRSSRTPGRGRAAGSYGSPAPPRSSRTCACSTAVDHQ